MFIYIALGLLTMFVLFTFTRVLTLTDAVVFNQLSPMEFEVGDKVRVINKDYLSYGQEVIIRYRSRDWSFTSFGFNLKIEDIYGCDVPGYRRFLEFESKSLERLPPPIIKAKKRGIK